MGLADRVAALERVAQARPMRLLICARNVDADECPMSDRAAALERAGSAVRVICLALADTTPPCRRAAPCATPPEVTP